MSDRPYFQRLWLWSTKSKGDGVSPFFNLLFVFGVAAFGLALAMYVYLGGFSRYYADDYCLTRGFLAGGFWKSQIDLYISWSPRFAGTFFINLSEFLGRSAIRGWTGFVILLWVISLSWAIAQVGRKLRVSLPFGLGVLLAEAAVFFTILEAPQQYQSIYWRVGLVTYTLPLVFLAFLIGLIFNRAGRSVTGRLPVGGVVACALLAFVAGGFSETYVTLQTCLLALVLIAVWQGVKEPDRGNWRLLAGASLIGSLLALVLVILAPGNAVRLAAMPARPSIFLLVRMAVTNAFIFIYSSLSKYAFQNLLTSLVALLISYELSTRAEGLTRQRPAHLTWGLFLTPLIGGLLILAVCTPSAYAESSYPEGRVLFEARFIMVALFFIEGALIGMSLGQLHQWSGEAAHPLLRLSTAFLFLLVSLYPVYDAWKTFYQIPVYRQRAERWDAHEAFVLASRGQGRMDVNILDDQARSFDEFSGLMEIGSQADYWVNQCAAGFFGLHSLTINQP